MLTVAYMTNRWNPRIAWFLDSLRRECAGDFAGMRLVVVDFFAEVPGRRESFAALTPAAIVHVPPKPTVWQGQFRLTRKDYFAASNARNTALCLAPDGWIVYVDDLSVLMPGWLAAVREAVAGGYIAAGAYRKVLGLEVRDGEVIGYRDFPLGMDSRWKQGSDTEAVPVQGSGLFGASVAGPVEAFLRINGWDEDCDSMGSEDYVCGLMLERAGYSLRYDRRMLTWESEEAHHEGTVFARIIKEKPRDASWAMLGMVLQGGRTKAPNYFPGGIRAVRDKVLAGEPFPNLRIPRHDWRDGQPLEEM